MGVEIEERDAERLKIPPCICYGNVVVWGTLRSP